VLEVVEAVVGVVEAHLVLIPQLFQPLAALEALLRPEVRAVHTLVQAFLVVLAVLGATGLTVLEQAGLALRGILVTAVRVVVVARGLWVVVAAVVAAAVLMQHTLTAVPVYIKAVAVAVALEF
jgi:hypothetical protein